MDITPVATLADLTEWNEVWSAALETDHVGLPANPIEERLPHVDGSVPEAGERVLLRTARTGGVAVAAVEIVLPTVDNLASASVDLKVHPEARRRGHARVLVEAVLAELRSLDRSRVFFFVAAPYPDGTSTAEPLLRSIGARPVLHEVRRLIDLAETPPPPPEPAPPGYRVVQWVDRAPEEHVDEMARLMGRMSTDTPMGDMDWEPEVWEAQRYRDKEASALARGRVRFATAVVHEATGRLAGMTDIGVSRHRPEVGYQWDTIVDPPDRGHGLGYVLKTHNHAQLARLSPKTRWVNTWNAASNEHMVRVNDRLGFAPVESWAEWQLDLSPARDAAG